MLNCKTHDGIYATLTIYDKIYDISDTQWFSSLLVYHVVVVLLYQKNIAKFEEIENKNRSQFHLRFCFARIIKVQMFLRA